MMITVFNRRELLITYDFDRQAEVRGLLGSAGITYALRIFNRNSAPFGGGSRARYGSFGERLELQNEYKIYVHKKDYDLAVALINGRAG
jgi:hypothetical protein